MRRGCQWIDEPEPAALPDELLYSPALFCGRPVVPGQPYCPTHHARARADGGKLDGNDPDTVVSHY